MPCQIVVLPVTLSICQYVSNDGWLHSLSRIAYPNMTPPTLAAEAVPPLGHPQLSIDICTAHMALSSKPTAAVALVDGRDGRLTVIQTLPCIVCGKR